MLPTLPGAVLKWKGAKGWKRLGQSLMQSI